MYTRRGRVNWGPSGHCGGLTSKLISRDIIPPVATTSAARTAVCVGTAEAMRSPLSSSVPSRRSPGPATR